MTDAERWKRIEAILDELLDLDPDARRSRLDGITGEDRELRPEIERLLAADAQSDGGVLDRGLGTMAAGVLGGADEPQSPAGKRIGPYRVLGELGRGGMGEVLLAERAEGDFEQEVALKIIRGGLARSEIVERFRRERRILARLSHPNIAALYDGGATDDGVPWFAMEYVEGERITEWCDSRQLSVDARVELFETVCRAVQYAHRNLVVHRDIKPSNVFVTTDGVVKLLDFGIGKLLDADAPDETQATRGFLTPAFAAPEQILQEATSTSSDVFSLGMLLYVLLTGHHPHGDTSRSVEIARAIAEDEAPDPSALAGKDSMRTSGDEIARCRGIDPAELRRRLKGDLDNILRKALRKDPDERYSSAQELREDLERYRRSIPVRARAATARYRLQKFVRRHRVGTLAAAVALLAALSGIAGVLWQANIAAHERDRARAVKDYLIEVFSAADPLYESGETLTALELVERGAVRISERFEEEPEIRVEITAVLGAVLTNLAQYERADEVLTAALEEHRRLNDVDGLHETLVRLGETARRQGNFDAALARYEEAVELGSREFGVEDPRSVDALSAKATVLLELGRIEEAGALSRETLDRAQRVFGEQSEHVAHYHMSLAIYLEKTGDLEGAEREIRAAITIYRESGVKGGRLANCMQSLGLVLELRDKSEESEEMLREAVAVLREEYGEEGHPDLALAITNLAGTLMQSNLAEASGPDRLAEAEMYLTESTEILERTLGPDHWMVGHAHSNLSVVKTKQGDIAAAGELLGEAVRVLRVAVGDRHPALGAPLSNLARNLLRQKRYEEAEVVYEEAMAHARMCFGDRHPNVSHPLTGYADLCSETGRHEEAEEAAIEGWVIRRDALGAGHSLVVETRVQIAGILAEAGRNDEAVEILDSAIEDARTGLPETRTVLASALVARARRGLESGEVHAEIGPLLTEALAIREEEYGVDDKRSVEVRDELALVRGGAITDSRGRRP